MWYTLVGCFLRLDTRVSSSQCHDQQQQLRAACRLLFALLALLFCGSSFTDPARKALTPQLVPQHELHLAATLDAFTWSLMVRFVCESHTLQNLPGAPVVHAAAGVAAQAAPGGNTGRLHPERDAPVMSRVLVIVWHAVRLFVTPVLHAAPRSDDRRPVRLPAGCGGCERRRPAGVCPR